MGRIMALDFGEARIGVALSDLLKTIATPHRVIYVREENPLDVIPEIVRDSEVERVIVGHPLLLSGLEGRMSELVQKFVTDLEGVIDVPIELVDERLTSKMAKRTLREKGEQPSREKHRVDLLSAAYLLEGYLESLRHRKKTS
jgi:putative Holliday junction resolvase